uniref:Putative monolaris n=1 Tax=Rhipicephalus pulchellus TaxID=72859 RepID=L7M915_RHIPC
MSYAPTLYFVLSAYFVPLHLASSLKTGTQALHKKCLTETTVEGCETILLSWSYNNETSECEKGFVCYGCPNRFETFGDCFDACSTVSQTTQKPKPQARPWHSKIKRRPWHRGCKYWLMHGACCQAVWLDFQKNFWGKKRRVLFYTGCRHDMYRVFAYDFSARRCREVKRRPRREGEQPNESEFEALRDRKRGCPRRTSGPPDAQPALPAKPAAANKPLKPTISNQNSKPATRPINTTQNKPPNLTVEDETSKPTAPNNRDKPTSPNQQTKSPKHALQMNTTQ